MGPLLVQCSTEGFRAWLVTAFGHAATRLSAGRSCQHPSQHPSRSDIREYRRDADAPSQGPLAGSGLPVTSVSQDSAEGRDAA
jgi:hypothetical protein